MDRDLVNLFHKTQKITKAGSYLLEGRTISLPKEDYSKTIYIPPETSASMLNEAPDKAPRRLEQCKFSVSQSDSLAAARELSIDWDYIQDAKASRILVLNFANSVSPGGGVRFGAKAQEEDLCRKSTLYASLTSDDAKPYYEAHAAKYSPLASHAMLLSPNVAVFRGSKSELLERPLLLSVLTCAAPIAHQRGDMSDVDYEALLFERIRRMLIVAAHYGYTHLILGAWGCGAFGNDAKQMAAFFRRAFLEFRYGRRTMHDMFHSVVFAVKSKSENPTYNYLAFRDQFRDLSQQVDLKKTRNSMTKKEAPETYQNRMRGSLFGGAVGDALGYPVEFMSLQEIKTYYGSRGITAYRLDPHTREALISDDTQMSLFTANGILYSETRWSLRGIIGTHESYVYLAYKDWLKTQISAYKPWNPDEERVSWLLDIPDLYSRRAPGNTCMGALRSGQYGSTSNSINNSSGCGGVMRVAPWGLYIHPKDREERGNMDKTGAEIAALTHSHPLGWLPAALLTHIVNMGVYDHCSIREAVEDAVETIEIVFSDTLSEMEYHPMKCLLEKAILLSENRKADTENIAELGEGWTGDEALAIAVYCALRHPDDFSAAVIAAVNHGGDSDSTGAITGNIVGAWVGYDAIEEKWKNALELKDIILEMADDLFKGCPLDEYSDGQDPFWLCKYVFCRHASTREEAQRIIWER